MKLPLAGALFLVALAACPVRGDDGPTRTALFVSGRDGYHTYRIPSLLVTSKGTVLAFCEARKDSAADHGDIDLVLRRSTDGGRTWGPMTIVADDGEHTIGNPCPVVDRRTGSVVLPYCRDNKQVFVTRSTDDGATWSPPVEITRDVGKPDWNWYATGPGVSIQTRSGRLVVPCDNRVTDKKVMQSHVILSDDGGATWRLGGVVGPLCNECQIAERTDGSLLLNIRSYRGTHRRLTAVSRDGGETFTPPVEDAALVEPVCQASLLRLPGDGGMLFSNPASTRRERLTIRHSRDDGATWTQGRVLHEGPAAYSCLAALPDGTVGCLYESGEKKPYEGLTLARFPVAWVMGK